jgi:hypothetical protein
MGCETKTSKLAQFRNLFKFCEMQGQES